MYHAYDKLRRSRGERVRCVYVPTTAIIYIYKWIQCASAKITRVETNKETRNRTTTTTATATNKTKNAKKHNNEKNMRLLMPRAPNRQIQVAWTTRKTNWNRTTHGNGAQEDKSGRAHNLETADVYFGAATTRKCHSPSCTFAKKRRLPIISILLRYEFVSIIRCRAMHNLTLDTYPGWQHLRRPSKISNRVLRYFVSIIMKSLPLACRA